MVRVSYDKNICGLRELKVTKICFKIWSKYDVVLRRVYWVGYEISVTSVDVAWSARVFDELYLAANRVISCCEYENIRLI
jgi:hypothetical protein